VKSNCEPTSRERTATRDDQGVANPSPPAEGAEQGLKISTYKRGSFTKLTLANDPATMHLLNTVGSRNPDFFAGLVDQIANASTRSEFPHCPDELGIKFMFSVIRGIEPRDQIETMIAAQMATVHVETMRYANILAHAEDLHERESAERGFVRLSRLFVSLVEALKSYRTRGEQRVTVRHVSVSEGEQAIVGNVNQSASEKPAGGTPALTDARQPAMPIIAKHERELVPVRQRRKLVPVRRRRKDDQRSSA
jgi:hypothetical protein